LPEGVIFLISFAPRLLALKVLLVVFAPVALKA
jgi:hypothetical protein